MQESRAVREFIGIMGAGAVSLVVCSGYDAERVP